MIDLEKLRTEAQELMPYGVGVEMSCGKVLELLDHITQIEKDAGRLDHLVTSFAIDGILGLQCLIDEDGFVLSSHAARQAIDTAMEASNG